MIEYEEEWLFPLIFRVKGSVAYRASLFAIPSAVIGVLILFLDNDLGYNSLVDNFGREMKASQTWSAATVAAVGLLSFRTKQSLSRFWEGTTLLHQMRGEWFDTVSNCVTFSICAKHDKPEEVKVFRHTLVRLMSLAHGSALEEISDYQVKVPTIDVFGLDHATLAHVQDCHARYHFNKVEIMLHLIQSLITKAQQDQVLTIPAPILSRVYQTISRGFVNLLNAKKITDTRFPFPYAQLISVLLLILVFLTPVLFSVVIAHKVLIFIITFIPVFGMFSLNFIAMELENPFGIDDNDLPLSHFQAEMNSCLMMLLHHNSDLISGISPTCEMDFERLYAAVCESNAEGITGARLSQLDTASSLGGSEDADADSSLGSATIRERLPDSKEPYFRKASCSSSRNSTNASTRPSTNMRPSITTAERDRTPPSPSEPEVNPLPVPVLREGEGSHSPVVFDSQSPDSHPNEDW
mmetsp:Transcript_112803/g.240766  ORF Transcript_112803/g.240766 Transcript_112803/m.240766 type:complete len:466 (+) Transcript_112803:88-1485(+)